MIMSALHGSNLCLQSIIKIESFANNLFLCGNHKMYTELAQNELYFIKKKSVYTHNIFFCDYIYI